MNYDNLHELINRYGAKIDLLYNEENDELFKWKALKCWQDEWFKPQDAFIDFANRFYAARKEFSLFIDNSRMHPSSGVLKLWEKEPETVEHLFYDVLLPDTGGNVADTQKNMEQFLFEYEKLREKYFPGNWSFKQDRHSASVFLALTYPEQNYAYKSSEALTMAKYIDFGFNIGAGGSFSLENYYKLCEEIIQAFRQHEDILEKHFSKLTDEHYYDESLHLLAFDFIYCCRTYAYYKGLIVPDSDKPKKAVQKPAAPEISPEELARREAERQQKIAEIEQEIIELENSCEGCEDISLLGVQVTSPQYGVGTVVDQNINRIKVKFSETEKSFILDKQYAARPRFEEDEEIVEIFSRYGRAQEKIKKLKEQLSYI